MLLPWFQVKRDPAKPRSIKHISCVHSKIELDTSPGGLLSSYAKVQLKTPMINHGFLISILSSSDQSLFRLFGIGLAYKAVIFQVCPKNWAHYQMDKILLNKPDSHFDFILVPENPNPSAETERLQPNPTFLPYSWTSLVCLKATDSWL